MKAVTIRFPEPLLTMIKETHAATYPHHRLSFNAWLVDHIRSSMMVSGDNIGSFSGVHALTQNAIALRDTESHSGPGGGSQVGYPTELTL